MKHQDLFEILKSHPYPGRGIVLGLTPDGTKAALAYFIMGRSAGSRSRAFVKNGDDLAIQMLDGGKILDTSLILYTPLRTLDGRVVVTNGDQTDTIVAALENGSSFEEALVRAGTSRTRRIYPAHQRYADVRQRVFLQALHPESGGRTWRNLRA
jgi:hypothetical protein